MEKEVFVKQITERAKKLEIILEDKQAEDFYQYMLLLIEWNKKMNLTAIIEPEEIIVKHFIDSLTIYPYIEKGNNILDVGTGAGFPGVPIKLVQDSFKVTLLDSLNKRICFLQEVIQRLKLKDIQAIHGRAEEFVKLSNQRENYEIVISRAVAKLNVLLEYMLPFVKIGGKCICMKALEVEEELEEAKKAIEILGGKIERIDTITLPESQIKRKIIIIKKVERTPMIYPRKAGMPTKTPIC
ncbi:MAG: 16S rRNA (guanine(527)-N(7))-methyltransferase RsmG [Clostridia bacterium]|nr:16S rRNA (guanine(527)-N(7))-methyltransferase RsmG [Clostridia bacterium]